MRAAAWSLLVVLALAGCASGPAPAASTPPASSSPTPSPPPPSDTVLITLAASRASIHPGETVSFSIVATNHRASSVWTNPSVVCTGSWDIVFRDASGERVVTDDRGSMGCPSGGALTTEVAPGASARVDYSWDGMLHEGPGSTRDAPAGAYSVTATVRWSATEGATNADGPDTRVGNATAMLLVERG
jgi:hypothetical protein